MHWPRLGPYHLARLAGAHAHAQTHGAEVLALETAQHDATYAWDEAAGDTSFAREVVFAGRVYEEISAAAMHRGVTAALDRLQPDALAITSYSTPDARASLMWCMKHRRIAVLMTETKEDDFARIGWRERVKSVIVGSFDAALAGGRPHRRYLEKLGFPPEAIFHSCDVIDNAYFIRHSDRARQNPESATHLPGLQSSEPYFLASNRFIARKNLESLLKAYKAYRDTSAHPWRLLLLGDGPLRERLTRMVDAEKIAGVAFCGFRQASELPAYYGLAGAFVHPASNDQWGLVVNEAMASGLPVLVSNKAGCASDLVAEGINGFTFTPNDTAKLARLLGHMSAPQTDRGAMGAASRERIAAWSPEAFGLGLWQAIEAGQLRSARRRLPGRAVLGVLQRLSRRVDSFQSEEA